MHRYLSSAEMADWLEHYDTWSHWEQQPSHTSAAASDKEEPDRVVTIFVFDLNTDELLLLDRHHQAVAYGDIIVAVQTQAPLATVDFSCNGRPVKFDPKDANREVIAALLQTVWGVTPTHLRWNSASHRQEIDYTWSMGLTPFGPFSSIKHDLSSAIWLTIRRNEFFSQLNSSWTQLQELANHMQTLDHEMAMAGSVTTHETEVLIRRLNVLEYKLGKATRWYRAGHFTKSLEYARSAQHDLRALHNVVHSILKRDVPLLTCETKSAPGSLPLSSSSSMTSLVRGVQLIALIVLVTGCALVYFAPLPCSRRSTSSRRNAAAAKRTL